MSTLHDDSSTGYALVWGPHPENFHFQSDLPPYPGNTEFLEMPRVRPVFPVSSLELEALTLGASDKMSLYFLDFLPVAYLVGIGRSRFRLARVDPSYLVALLNKSQVAFVSFSQV